MKNPSISLSPELGDGSGLDAFPGEAELAALRGWYADLSSRKSVAHYLDTHKVSGQSSRGMIGGIRRQLIRIARRRHRADLVALLDHPIGERVQHAKAVAHAIDALRLNRLPRSLMT